MKVPYLKFIYNLCDSYNNPLFIGKSFSFTIEDTEKKKLHQIKIELYSSIGDYIIILFILISNISIKESSSYKSKKDKFIITLKKLVEGTWHKLKA